VTEPVAPEPGPPSAGFGDGVRLAVTTFTIAPVRSGAIDRTSARIAMALAPAVGAVLGGLTGGVVVGLHAIPAPALLIGLLGAGLLAGLTRGLHLDGLADTVDGLGSHRPAERALAIMKSPEVGPFGVVALILAIGVPAACLAVIAGRPWWSVLAGTAAACATGRLAAAFACRRGVPAAAPTGLGAAVAGTVGAVELAYGLVGTVAIGLGAVPGRIWQGPVAVLVALALTIAFVRHVTRRLGGITGDVLGACVEIGSAAVLTGIVLGAR
jgi:adenosylcobinamide-GDP ribazoletransferase